MNTFIVRSLLIGAIVLSLSIFSLPRIRLDLYNEAFFGSFIPLIMWFIAYRTARWNMLSTVAFIIAVSCIAMLAVWFVFIEMLTNAF